MSQLSLVLASKYCFNFVKWIPEKSFVGKKQKTEKGVGRDLGRNII